jgi:hypothetical protein
MSLSRIAQIREKKTAKVAFAIWVYNLLCFISFCYVPDEGYSRHVSCARTNSVPDEGYSRHVSCARTNSVPDEGYFIHVSCARTNSVPDEGYSRHVSCDVSGITFIRYAVSP